MKFEELLKFFGHRPWFDFEMLRLASGEAAECVHTEVYRWRRTGKVIELRRGLFVLAEPWRKQAVKGPELANAIYPPSYLSGRWALGFWGLLGKAPGCEYCSVTARPARVFKNSFGTYSYVTLPRDLLFGTTALPVASAVQPAEFPENGSLKEQLGRSSLPRIALPEKAFLDLCFIKGGEWDAARLTGLGLIIGASRPESIPGIPNLDPAKVRAMAERSGRPRLIKAAKALSILAANRRSAGKQIGEAVIPELPWNEEGL
jgi:hypothetical protein